MSNQLQPPTKKWPSKIHLYEWYLDTKGSTWVVTAIYYENGEKDVVCLLELGKSSPIMQPYTVVQKEIKGSRIQLFYR